MNEKVRSRVQAAEMRFLRRISGLTLLNNVKSADIREYLNIESLLLRQERSQLRWYGHVTRMSLEKTAKKCSIPHRWVEGLEAIPELDGEITLKILVDAALALHRSRGLKCLNDPTRAAAPATPQRLAGLEKLVNHDISRVMCLNKKKFLKKHACLSTIEQLCCLNIRGDIYSLVPPRKIIEGVWTPSSPPRNLRLWSLELFCGV